MPVVFRTWSAPPSPGADLVALLRRANVRSAAISYRIASMRFARSATRPARPTVAAGREVARFGGDYLLITGVAQDKKETPRETAGRDRQLETQQPVQDRLALFWLAPEELSVAAGISHVWSRR